jgi:DNA-directed RNA polymerase specialized sigma24 family protein
MVSTDSNEEKLRRILGGLSSREREALYRFYFLEQSCGQISQDLAFDEDEWQRLKARVRELHKDPQ